MDKYTFTQSGTADFLEALASDILDNHDYNDIVVRIGSRAIAIPLYPETFEALEDFIKDAYNLYKEEYEADKEG